MRSELLWRYRCLEVVGRAWVVSLLVFPIACTRSIPDFACADCNLVLVSIDTLRADRLGCYGGPRPTSPNLDRLASQAIVFENALAPSFHTADSHASIFTATVPSVHGLTNPSSRVGSTLPKELTTLAEALSQAGLATAGFHGGGNVSPVFGFGRGFGTYEYSGNLRAGPKWVKGLNGRRFFLFLHTLHTHDPYTPSREAMRRLGIKPRDEIDSDLEHLRGGDAASDFLKLRDRFWANIDKGNPEDVAYALALYDAEILEADELVTTVVGDILKVAPRTVVVITSDHGEAFGEHGTFLHDSLFQEVLHVPLLIRYPSAEPMTVRDFVSLVDLAPSLLETLGVPIPPTFQGRSWLPALRGNRSFREPLLAEKMAPPAGGEAKVAKQVRLSAAAVAGGTKVIFRSAGGPLELYDLRRDPLELSDLAPLDGARLGVAKERLERLMAASDAFAARQLTKAGPDSVAVPEEVVEQLRALGYLQ